MGRAPCCDKANVKKGPWSPEEDATLKAYIEQHGTGGNWIALPQKIGIKRCGKSCRLRWLNYLRPNIKHGGFSEEEDNIICNLYINIGSRWSIIAAQLPGRTDNDIKNYWNTRLKKKLLGKQRKEFQEAARLKQEMVKRENQTENYNIFSGTTTTTTTGGTIMSQQTLYWSQLPQYVMNQEPDYYHPRDQDQEPIKNMIKIEEAGSFSGDTQKTNMASVTNYQIPYDFSFSQDHYGGLPMNSVMSSSTNSPLQNNQHNVVTGASNQEIPQGFENFPIEAINNMVLNVFSLDGLEINNYYGGGSTVGTSTSADHSTISWDDISSLVYPPPHQIVSDQSTTTFEDASYFGDNTRNILLAKRL